MARSRRRTVRLIVALTCAILLSGALLYTSFSQSSQSMTPSQLLAAAEPGEVYELTGKVAEGTWKHEGAVHSFSVENRVGGGDPVPVRYAGSVPDPFREGREIVIKVRRDGEGFVGEKDSLITKCPSKFEEDKPGDGSGMSS
jgi:cytochrome c-type biogenesis protein CcmE